MDIADLLHPQDILLRFQARAKREVLRQLAGQLADRSCLPIEVTLLALLGRESLGSTCIGHGTAVPHALVSDLLEPAAAMAVLERPVCFHAPDDQPVDVVLALIWPRRAAERFAPTLSHLHRVLLPREIHDGICRASTHADIFASLERGSAYPSTSQPRVPVPSAWVATRVSEEKEQ